VGLLCRHAAGGYALGAPDTPLMLPCAPLPVSATSLPLQVQHPPAVSSRRRSHDRPPLSPLSPCSSSAAATASAALELGWTGAQQADTRMHEEDTAEAQLMLMECPPQPQPGVSVGAALELERGCEEGAGAVAVHPAFQRWTYQFSGGLAGKGAYGECWRGMALDGRGTAVVLKRLFVQLSHAVQLQVTERLWRHALTSWR
jgi:hypothetical protein